MTPRSRIEAIQSRFDAASKGPYSGMLRAWLAEEKFPSDVPKEDLKFLARASIDIEFLLERLKSAVKIIDYYSNASRPHDWCLLGEEDNHGGLARTFLAEISADASDDMEKE